MKTPVPIGACIICKKVEEFGDEYDLVSHDQEKFCAYEVISVGSSPECSAVHVGDKVVANSTGIKILTDGSESFLFKIENIIGEIE